MSAALKKLVDDVERVWSPPAGRAWGLDTVAIVKLLKAIKALPVETREKKLETGIREALDGLPADGAAAEILRRALR